MCLFYVHSTSSDSGFLTGFLFSLSQNRVYTFDHVFKPNASQEEVYMISAKPIVKGRQANFLIY